MTDEPEQEAPERVTTCPCCGFKIRPAKGKKPRSYDQLKRYMKVCFEAWFNWPDRMDPETGELKREFENPDTFRKWIQMKAGYRKLYADIELEGTNREWAMMMVEASIRAAGAGDRLVIPVLHGSRMAIFHSESIAYPDGRRSGMEHSEFCKLSEAVEATIKGLSGLDPDQMLEEAKRRVKT